MENASKALIIAGAILLSILLISLGMMVYNQASGIANSDQMSALEISTFNSKFTQYEGSAISGANVNALLELVTTSNRTNTAQGIEISLVGACGTGAHTLMTTVTKALTGKTYEVTVTNYSTAGYVSEIKIEQKL